MHLRALDASDGGLLGEATLGNFNWSGERFTMADVLTDPKLARYARFDPGRGDFGLVLETETEASVGKAPTASRSAESAPDVVPVGVVWALFLPESDPGDGFVDSTIPELSLWVHSAHRGRGHGRRLMRALLEEATGRGLEAVSLSVELGNSARRLYESEGFTQIPGREGDGVMLRPSR